ncbi:MAG: hypothetical protein JJU31_08540 [Wenzhouxiangella sp.]|nr:hypothetical protein [Wenzhouxiangella sp.]MCH8478064.1 hypothetical protein [Wenzhouxiangella sp.]TVR94715.1 MAG: hypothetical protein EA418_09560 [Wenzhouxiangellaceae bacterium]
MNEANNKEINVEPGLAYERPDFDVNPLRIVTLGGISGSGDSGAPNIERVPGDGTFDDSDWDFGD